MTTKNTRTISAVIIAAMIVLSGLSVSLLWITLQEKTKDATPVHQDKSLLLQEGISMITKELFFSEPSIKEYDGFSTVYLNESTMSTITIGRPVLPSNISVIEFPFGTKILNVSFIISSPKTIDIPNTISFGSYVLDAKADTSIYESDTLYPQEYVTYHTAGGLSHDEHTTFLIIKVNPLRYQPKEQYLEYIEHVTIDITYKAPSKALLDSTSAHDLLILAPSSFTRLLKPLVDHKNAMGIDTVLVTLEEVYDTIVDGRDQQEAIKYYIKSAIEKWGITYVLLVGGMKGQSIKWYLPIRYSHVLIPEGTQEILEPEFISDLYYADVYDSEGNFSSWDSNDNDIFAEWDGQTKDSMDLYPDVYLGRLACRNTRELRTVVNKIITYEKNKADDNWFSKILLVSGDHWKDPDHINEGALIMDEAAAIMSDFTPIRLIATEEDTILVRDINRAFNSGAGFAYFSGHGSPAAWGIHYPPDAEGWAPTPTRLSLFPFYFTFYMNLLRNKEKLPVTIVGGCNNAQYDISVATELRKGKLPTTTTCWAWKLVSKRGGGSIATIANTGLGTHAMGDSDKNSICDYLEILDGWMELRFLELCSSADKQILGRNYGQTMTEYLNRFINNVDEMDTKMVQQWQLFGDPSLRIGGYP